MSQRLQGCVPCRAQRPVCSRNPAQGSEIGCVGKLFRVASLPLEVETELAAQAARCLFRPRLTGARKHKVCRDQPSRAASNDRIIDAFAGVPPDFKRLAQHPLRRDRSLLRSSANFASPSISDGSVAAGISIILSKPPPYSWA